MTRRRPPTQEQLESARELLGVGANATREEISAAWKQILRRTHPDAADDSERPAADRISAQVNEARDLLIENLDAPTVAHTPPGNGTRRVATPSGQTRPPVDDDARAGRGILMGLIGFMALALTAIVTVVIIAGGSNESRIDADDEPVAVEDTASRPNPHDTGTAADNTLGADLPSPTPEVGTQLLLFAISTGNIDVLQYIVSPGARQDDLAAILTALNPADATTPTELRIAANSIECTQTPGIRQALCAITRPDSLLPRQLEWVETDGVWRLAGWGPSTG